MARQQCYILEILILVMVFLNQSDHVSCDSAADFRLSLKTDTIETFAITTNKIFHLADDRFVPGNILFSDCCSLQTTDGNVTHMIVGSLTELGYREGNGTTARFRVLRGFLQLNETAVIVVDDFNHCLRLVDRLTNQTSVHAGNCTYPGAGGGSFLKASFNHPQQIIVDDLAPTRLLLTEAGNKVVRRLDTVSNRVWDFSNRFAGQICGIVQVHPTGDFFVAEPNLVHRLFRIGKRIETVAGYEAENTTPIGWFDGPLSKVLFYQTREIILISNGTKLLVADQHSQRIRILDLITNTSSSIGSGFPAHDDGLLSDCTLFQPISLMESNGTMYIGGQGRIRAIKAQQTPETTEQTETSCATSTSTTSTIPQPCASQPSAVTKIFIASIVVIVTVSIVILTGAIYYKLKIQSGESGDNSTNISWSDLNDDAVDDETKVGPNTGCEVVEHTSYGTNNNVSTEYEGRESRTSHVYTSPEY